MVLHCPITVSAEWKRKSWSTDGTTATWLSNSLGQSILKKTKFSFWSFPPNLQCKGLSSSHAMLQKRWFEFSSWFFSSHANFQFQLKIEIDFWARVSSVITCKLRLQFCWAPLFHFWPGLFPDRIMRGDDDDDGGDQLASKINVT